MKSRLTCYVVLLLCMAAAAQTTSSTSTATTKPTRKARSSARATTGTAAEIRALREAIAAQQNTISQQQSQIQQLQGTVQQMQSNLQSQTAAVQDAQSNATAASTTASQQEQTVNQLRSDVSDIKQNSTATAGTVQEVQKSMNGLESPLAIHYKGVTLTPGGFLAAETVYRNRGLGADINTPFNSIPMPGAPNVNTSEFFGSGRQSRISLLGQGAVKSAKLAGYYEADFLSAGVTSNNNESNSYTLRQRQVWGQAALESGFTFTGGQMWSLVTETTKGLDNRSEALPMTIDPQYTVGFSWARQYGFRVTKNFANKVWLGFSVENSQETITAHNNPSNSFVGTAGTLGGLYNSLANYSFNSSPDFVVKAAFEPGFGHYEIFGLESQFRARVYPCATASKTSPCAGSAKPSASDAFNDNRTGGGFGANARWNLADKKVVFGLHGLAGDGVGRYGTGGLADATFRPDGTVSLIRSYQALGTLEYHGKKLDIYTNVGGEYAGRTAYENSKKQGVGYGSALFNNKGCSTEPLPSGSNGFSPGSLSNCTADTRDLIEGTIGLWYRIYQGPYGRLQLGPQYSYIVRNTWNAYGGAPHGIDNMFFTSFRYYIP
jgi:hypothetical protein